MIANGDGVTKPFLSIPPMNSFQRLGLCDLMDSLAFMYIILRYEDTRGDCDGSPCGKIPWYERCYERSRLYQVPSSPLDPPVRLVFVLFARGFIW